MTPAEITATVLILAGWFVAFCLGRASALADADTERALRLADAARAARAAGELEALADVLPFRRGDAA